LRNQELLREAYEAHLQQNEEHHPKDKAELRKLEKEIRKIRATIDNYLTAFESGKMSPEVCGPRVEGLHTQQLEIQARIETLRASSDQVSTLPALDEIEAIANELTNMLESLGEEDLAKFKDVLRIVVPKILVGSRLEIRPTIHLPLVPVNASKVGASGFEPLTAAL
jgi:hypothetical protein